MWLGRVCVSFVFLFLARACIPYLSALIIYYFTPGCMCISKQQLVRMFDGGAWDKSYSSGIWDGKNDPTIGNEMVSEWIDSGKWDGRKSVKVGNGIGSEWADSGTEREWDRNSSSCGGTGNAGTEISNGRGRETSVGKRNIATVPVPVPFPYRPVHFFPVPTFTARSPALIATQGHQTKAKRKHF